MSLPARKLVMSLAAFISGLLSAAALASAEDPIAPFDAVGLVDEQPLPDVQMTALRGGGFVADLSAALLNGLAPAAGAPLPGSIASSSGDWLSALRDGMPSINLVTAQLNDQPTVMRIGTAPQSLGCGNGLSCPTGMIVDLAASNSLPAGSVSLSIAIAH